MNITVTNAAERNGVPLPVPAGRGRALLIWILARCQTWLERRAALEELYMLDACSLHDLGICRSDFEAIASGRYMRVERQEGSDSPREPEAWPAWRYY
jgi:uncharacterized protein YjiS (DUF1127 family)